MIELSLNDWDAILTEFEGPRFASSDWLFRGEHDSQWKLQTSLERHTPAEVLPLRAEDKLLSEFQKRAHVYLPPQLIPIAPNSGEWLALMQHFGAPTRLSETANI